MITFEEKKQILNKRISEITKVYEDNLNNAEITWNEAEHEAIRVLQKRDIFGKYKEQRLLLLDRLNEAEMSIFVNREFSFLISLIKDIAFAILELRDDLEKTSSSVNVNIPKIETHHEVFLALAESLEKKKKQNEEKYLRKEEDQKRFKDLKGKMYG